MATTPAVASLAVRLVHVAPSGEVITWWVPVIDTAQNRDKFGDQQTAFQLLASLAVLAVQVVPSGEV